MTPEEQIARGEHAKRLLDDPLLKEALAEIKQAIVESWAALPVENTAQAEKLKHLLWATKQFEAIFVAQVGGATIARSELLLDTNMQIKAEAVTRRFNET
ncbi:MAG: hypothetical protein AB1807_11990 [Pseudomonadota bacterium]